ncbi:hypothetical protein ACJ41O_000474 [Fusarium nematophilum]
MAILDATPRPTAPPSPQELERRTEATTPMTVFYAPDSVCGYISERPGASRVCPSDDICFFIPPHQTSTGGIACCGSTSCQYHATCINYEEYYESSKCDGGCEVDNFTLKWQASPRINLCHRWLIIIIPSTNTASPYCNTVEYFDTILDYWCNDLDITTRQSAETTFSGQSSRSFGTVDEEEFSSLESQISQAASGNVGQTTETRRPDSSDNDKNNDDDGGGGGGGSSTGAIVGGVVGGVGTIALVGLGIFLYFRRKKKSQAANPPAYQPPGSESKGVYPSPGQQPGGNAYHYDPNNPNTPSAQTISPNSVYSQQQQVAGFQPGFVPQQAVIHEVEGEGAKSQPQELAETGPGKKEPVELS